jgi:hypothetical protein
VFFRIGEHESVPLIDRGLPNQEGEIDDLCQRLLQISKRLAENEAGAEV